MQLKHRLEHHFNVDSINPNEDCCYFYSRNQDKLLITIGESWTWGDSLEDHGFDRFINVWGWHLSKKLNSDWLNIARKGASNLWIFYQLQELERFGKLDYDHVQIVFCCTEWGREYTERWDWYKGFDLKLQRPEVQNACLIEFAKKYIQDYSVLIAHNFCDGKYWQHDLLQLDKNWIEITCNKIGVDYKFKVPTVGHYQTLKKTGMDLQDILDLQDKSLGLVDFLESSKYNYKRHSKHPTPESHQFWADYIYETINLSC